MISESEMLELIRRQDIVFSDDMQKQIFLDIEEAIYRGKFFAIVCPKIDNMSFFEQLGMVVRYHETYDMIMWSYSIPNKEK
jgi:hypothetical protein